MKASSESGECARTISSTESLGGTGRFVMAIASSFSRFSSRSSVGRLSRKILARVFAAPTSFQRPVSWQIKKNRRVKEIILDSRKEILTMKSEQKKRRRDHYSLRRFSEAPIL